MLEGVLDKNTGYFITIDVAALSKEDACELAVLEWNKSEIQNPRIEEVAWTERRSGNNFPEVVKTYGRSYFPLTD